MPARFPHDDFGDAAAAARSEWRADEEAWTRAAVERWLHERTLLDVARECLHRGDTVNVRFADRVFCGRVGAVGDDLFSLELVEGRVDVAATRAAPFVLRVAARARSGGARGDHVTTMRARLLELELAGCEVEIGLSVGDTVRGHMSVGRDHVVVRSPGTTTQAGTADVAGSAVVPMGAVAWVLAGPVSRR
jgi:hypothetical protein